MKRYYFVCLMLGNLLASAQFQARFLNGVKGAGGNFREIQTNARAYFSANPDTSEGGTQREFERWEWFWSTRVGSSDSSINGTFRPALSALSSLLQNPVCTSSPYIANWNPLGPNSFQDQAEGMVLAVAFDPVNPTTTFYAGTPNSGVWRTTDGGSTWQSLTESLHLPGLGVNDIKIDPHHNNVIYIATGMTRQGSYGLGVLKSTDGGSTWNSTALTFNPSQTPYGITHKLLIDPNNSNVLYALADDMVYKTTDGGITWPSIFQLQQSTAFPGNSTACCDRYSCSYQTRRLIDIEMKPSDPQTLYISSDDQDNAASVGTSLRGCTFGCGVNSWASNGNGGAELWKTTDAGLTWTELTPVTTGSSSLYTSNNSIIHSNGISIAVSPADPNSIFINYSIAFGSSFFQKSPDGGVTWLSPHNSSGTFLLEVSPTNTVNVYVGGLEVFKSTNGGGSFSMNSDYSATTHTYGGHGDIRALAIIANGLNDDAILMGNDGGVGYKSSNSSPTWANVSQSLPISQFYGFGGTEKNSGLIIGGTQDNGIFTFNAGIWTRAGLSSGIGDAYDCVFDFNNPQICYGENNTGSNSLDETSAGGGTSWFGIMQPAEASTTVRPIEVNPINNKIYVGYNNVWISQSPSNSSGVVWVKKSDFHANFGVSSNNTLTALAVAPTNTNVIYCAYGGVTWSNTATNFFFRTTSGGGTGSGAWQDITSNANSANGLFKWFPITSIVVNPYYENELWITVGGFANPGAPRVMHSADYGNTWNDYSTNLPVFPANKIVYEKGSNDALYVGTDVGVFYRNKSMSQWECFTDNLPVCVVTDLEINYATNSLRASTFGRGIWEAQLACPVTTDVIESAPYVADAFIEAGSNLYSSADDAGYSVNYRAVNQVDLQPGFHASATSSASFHAFIHGCSAPGNSFHRYMAPGSNSGDNSSLINSSESFTMNKSSLETKRNYPELRVQPNPNNGTFTINILNNFNPENLVEVSDLTGRKVFTKTFIKQQEVLDLNIENGTYLIKYTDGVNANSQMIIINK